MTSPQKGQSLSFFRIEFQHFSILLSFKIISIQYSIHIPASCLPPVIPEPDSGIHAFLTFPVHFDTMIFDHHSMTDLNPLPVEGPSSLPPPNPVGAPLCGCPASCIQMDVSKPSKRRNPCLSCPSAFRKNRIQRRPVRTKKKQGTNTIVPCPDKKTLYFYHSPAAELFEL